MPSVGVVFVGSVCVGKLQYLNFPPTQMRIYFYGIPLPKFSIHQDNKELSSIFTMIKKFGWPSQPFSDNLVLDYIRSFA